MCVCVLTHRQHGLEEVLVHRVLVVDVADLHLSSPRCTSGLRHAYTRKPHMPHYKRHTHVHTHTWFCMDMPISTARVRARAKPWSKHQWNVCMQSVVSLRRYLCRDDRSDPQ